MHTDATLLHQSTSVAIVAASRLVFAVARDGVLPLSSWIGQVDAAKQPRNAVTVMFVFGAALLCTILPSQVAFTSLISAGAIPTTAAYGLIALLRLTMSLPANPSAATATHRNVRPILVLLFSATRPTLHLPLLLPASPRPFLSSSSPTQGLDLVHLFHLLSRLP